MVDILELHLFTRGVLYSLHLRVDNTRIAALAIDVMYLCDISGFRYCRIEDVVDIDREELEETLLTSGGDSVDSIVVLGPGVGSL
jgi:hypothetical protein